MTKIKTEAERVDLRELLAKATHGPWKNFRCFGALSPNEICKADNYASGGIGVVNKRGDADLIVEAINALPDLLSLQDELVEALEGMLEGALAAYIDDDDIENARSLLTRIKSERDEA